MCVFHYVHKWVLVIFEDRVRILVTVLRRFDAFIYGSNLLTNHVQQLE